MSLLNSLPNEIIEMITENFDLESFKKLAIICYLDPEIEVRIISILEAGYYQRIAIFERSIFFLMEDQYNNFEYGRYFIFNNQTNKYEVSELFFVEDYIEIKSIDFKITRFEIRRDYMIDFCQFVIKRNQLQTLYSSCYSLEDKDSITSIILENLLIEDIEIIETLLLAFPNRIAEIKCNPRLISSALVNLSLGRNVICYYPIYDKVEYIFEEDINEIINHLRSQKRESLVFDIELDNFGAEITDQVLQSKRIKLEND